MAVRGDVLVLVVVQGRADGVVQNDVDGDEGLLAEALEELEVRVLVAVLVLGRILEGVVADVRQGFHKDPDEVLLLVVRAQRRQVDALGLQRHVLRMGSGINALQGRPSGREWTVASRVEADGHALGLRPAQHRVGLEVAVVPADRVQAGALGGIGGPEDRKVY